jgi:thioredoxin reductase (NADPH)
MQDRVMASEKIEILWNRTVVDVLGDSDMTGIRVKDTVSGEETDMKMDGLFLGIGHKPNTAIFQEWLDLDPNGYIQTEADSTHTGIPGVFACGDAQDHVYRQAVTAAGTGCMAAIDAERWLAEREAAVAARVNS